MLKLSPMDIMYIFMFVNLMSKNSGTSEVEYTLPGQLYFLVSELPIHFPCLFFCLQLPHFDHKSSHNILSTWLCASHCTRCFKIILFLKQPILQVRNIKNMERKFKHWSFLLVSSTLKAALSPLYHYTKKPHFTETETPKGRNPPKHSQSCS